MLPSRLIFHAHLLCALTSFLSLLLCLFPLEKIKLGHIFLLLLFTDLNGINSKEETELMLCCTCTGRCRRMDSSVGTGAMYGTVRIALETSLSSLSSSCLPLSSTRFISLLLFFLLHLYQAAEGFQHGLPPQLNSSVSFTFLM